MYQKVHLLHDYITVVATEGVGEVCECVELNSTFHNYINHFLCGNSCK